MVHHGGDGCEQEAELERLRQQDLQLAQNDRFQRELLNRLEQAVNNLNGHMAQQTRIMVQLASQGEQLVTVQRDQRDDRLLIDKLFVLTRDLQQSLVDFQQKINEKLHQHEMEPVKEKRVERLRFSTGLWLLALGALLNQLIVYLKGLARVGAP